MTLDMAQGVQSTIGPVGGTFSATGANGDVYTLLQHGWRTLATRPASTCADLQALTDGIIGIERIREIFGIESEDSAQKGLGSLLVRFWTVCFPEKLQICLETGDLRVLVEYAIAYERNRQLVAVSETGWSCRGLAPLL